MTYDAIIIGAGFFGVKLSLFLASQKLKVAVIEEQGDICLRSSQNNQARIHNGYHYLRSYKTALSSHKNYARFIQDYKDCSYSSFQALYSIAKNSFTNSVQFEDFCNRLDLPYKKIDPGSKFANFFNSDLIASSYHVDEITFDINKLRTKLREELKEKEEFIDLKLKTKVNQLDSSNGQNVIVNLSNNNKLKAKKVFNVTYAGINRLLKASSLGTIPLKYEVAELALVDVPEEFQDSGITVMDGPFFSCIPFPSKNCYSLSHVRYTPQSYWHESELSLDPYSTLENLKSNYIFMKKDAQRYMPILSKLKYKESLYEAKTIVSRNETDDGRPIVLKKHSDNIYSILGTKLDNIYDLEERIEEII